MSDHADTPDSEALLRHGASVRALAAAILGDAAAAEDIAQETFLAALGRGDVPGRNPGAWLRGVGRNLARRWMRTESRRRRREGMRPRPTAPASPVETAARLEAEARLTEAVRALPEPYRTVVVLRYFDGLTTAETADRTGAPEATVKTRLRRALALLRDALDDRYGARAAWLPLLVRVARPPVPSTGAAAAGTAALVAGGAIMAKKILVATAFAAVLAAALMAPELTERPGPSPPPEGVREESPEVAIRSEAAPDTGVEADPLEPGEAPGTSAGRPGERFRTVVRYPDGSPAEGARLRLVGPGGDPVGEATTGADGSASLPATGVAAVVRVFPPRAAPESRDVEALAGTEVVVNLKLGEEVSGVLFMGDEPAPGVTLKLNSISGSLPGMAAVTDECGRFRFTGLAPGWRGSLFAGWEVYFVEPQGRGMRQANVRVVAPATALELRAIRYPRVTGRVVGPDGGAVAGARVSLSYRDVEGGGGTVDQNRLETDRFSISMMGVRKDLVKVTLTVTGPDGTAREVAELDPARVRCGSLDAGTIVVRPARTFAFVIRGPDGSPVPGAVVMPADDEFRASRPADAAGRTKLAVSGGATAARAGAPGEGVAEVPLPETPAGPISVDLPGGTLLTVRVRTKGGAVPACLSLIVEAEAKLLEGPWEMGDPLYARAGARSPGSTEWSEKHTRCIFLIRGGGALRIAGIRPGVPFRVAVLDRVTDRRLEVRELTLDPAERREVDFALSIAERSLVVRVTDPEGRPLAGARAVVTAGGLPLSATTNDAGAARIHTIRGDAARLTVTKAGRAPFVSAPLRVKSLPEALTVVLRPGRTVRLTVTDVRGATVRCEMAEARVPNLDYRFEGYDEGGGLFRFTDIPEEEVRLAVRFAGARYEVVADAATAEARLTVPEAGSVVVRFDFRLDEPTSHRIRLVPASGSAGTEVTAEVGYNPYREHWLIRIPAVLPAAYRVTLEHRVARDEGDAAVYETCRTGPVIEVAAGLETETRLPR